MDMSEYAAGKLWQAFNDAAIYNHPFGLETAWRDHFQDWGFPIEEGEVTVNVPGVGSRNGRTFTKVGFVYWDPAHGAVVGGI